MIVEIFQPTMQPPILAAGTCVIQKHFEISIDFVWAGTSLVGSIFLYVETANEKGFRDNYCKKILIVR